MIQNVSLTLVNMLLHYSSYALFHASLQQEGVQWYNLTQESKRDNAFLNKDIMFSLFFFLHWVDIFLWNTDRFFAICHFVPTKPGHVSVGSWHMQVLFPFDKVEWFCESLSDCVGTFASKNVCFSSSVNFRPTTSDSTWGRLPMILLVKGSHVRQWCAYVWATLVGDSYAHCHWPKEAQGWPKAMFVELEVWWPRCFHQLYGRCLFWE